MITPYCFIMTWNCVLKRNLHCINYPDDTASFIKLATGSSFQTQIKFILGTGKLLKNIMAPLITIITHMFFKCNKMITYYLGLPTPGDFHFSQVDSAVLYCFPVCLFSSRPASLPLQVTGWLPNPLLDIAQPSLSACTRLRYMVKCWDGAARLANDQESLLNLHLWRLHEQLGHIKDGVGWSLDKSDFLESCPSFYSVIYNSFCCTGIPAWPVDMACQDFCWGIWVFGP